MAFKVTARTLLQLGSELISSDAIAFYELIKNAFDANSTKALVRVVIRIPNFIYTKSLLDLNYLETKLLLKKDDQEIEEAKQKIKRQLLNALYEDSYEVDLLRRELLDSESVKDLIYLTERANYILIRDTGEGMSITDLQDVYLTIGTPSRLIQKQEVIKKGDGYDNGKPILGEKGIGRLSVMRLGESVKIITTKKGEEKYNVLEIDWNIFANRADVLLESISVDPEFGSTKTDKLISGTDIYIYKLTKDWTVQVLQDIATEQLSKLIDPFQSNNRNFIQLWYNKEPVIIRNLNRVLFKNAHALVEGRFVIEEDNLFLKGNIDYYLYQRHKTFNVGGTHLTSITQSTIDVLKSLGPFSFKFYWFNNRIVKELDGIGNIAQVRELIKGWAGGLMVYRDGFRVYPYGSLNDDWLQIDPAALGAAGYKVNRRQIIGKIDISSLNNPALIDQTNREGLRDSPEKMALIKLLQHVLWAEFRTLLNTTEKEKLTIESLDLEELELRIDRTQINLNRNLDFLINKFPEINSEKETINIIRTAIAETNNILKAVQSEKETMDRQREVTLNLAGLGLMVDIVAHELNRSTENALKIISDVDKDASPMQSRSLLNTLSAQLKTLQTRLKFLDPLSPSGRQIKEFFYLNDLVNEVVESHQAQFERHKIKCEIYSTHQGGWKIKAVKGMFVQILENLISNSVYWLKQHKIRLTNFTPKITILIDKPTSCLLFTDNGPGIPILKKEDVFLPFVTTKPPGDGKGLGLYISREIAKYHGATLELNEKEGSESDNLHTFILNLTNLK